MFNPAATWEAKMRVTGKLQESPTYGGEIDGYLLRLVVSFAKNICRFKIPNAPFLNN